MVGIVVGPYESESSLKSVQPCHPLWDLPFEVGQKELPIDFGDRYTDHYEVGPGSSRLPSSSHFRCIWFEVLIQIGVHARMTGEDDVMVCGHCVSIVIIQASRLFTCRLVVAVDCCDDDIIPAGWGRDVAYDTVILECPLHVLSEWFWSRFVFMHACMAWWCNGVCPLC